MKAWKAWLIERECFEIPLVIVTFEMSLPRWRCFAIFIILWAMMLAVIASMINQ
jgi:hypothetical protein